MVSVQSGINVKVKQRCPVQVQKYQISIQSFLKTEPHIDTHQKYCENNFLITAQKIIFFVEYDAQKIRRHLNYRTS